MFSSIARLGTLVSLAVACGGGAESPKTTTTSAATQPETKAAPKIEACSLLTVEEIEAVVGWKSAKAEPSLYGGTAVCNFSGPQGLSQIVSLLVAPGMPKVANSAEMAEWRKEQTEGYGDVKFVIEPVEGLGVPAIRNEIEGAGLVTIEAAVKGVLLDVSTSSLDQAKALTAKAIARVP
jgi:hypothetical protein